MCSGDNTTGHVDFVVQSSVVLDVAKMELACMFRFDVSFKRKPENLGE